MDTHFIWLMLLYSHPHTPWSSGLQLCQRHMAITNSTWYWGFPNLTMWPLRILFGAKVTKSFMWPLRLLLDAENVKSVIWPLSIPFGTKVVRSLTWPVKMLLDTKIAKFLMWLIRMLLDCKVAESSCGWQLRMAYDISLPNLSRGHWECCLPLRLLDLSCGR